MKIRIKELFPYLVLFLNLKVVVYNFLRGNSIAFAYDYLLDIVIGVVSVIYFFKNRKLLKKRYPYLVLLYQILIIYILYGALKQFFVPSGLYPLQRMKVVMGFLSFSSIFFFSDERVLKKLFHIWIKWFPLLFIVFFLALEPSSYYPFLMLFTFYQLFFPLLKRKNKIIIVIITLFLMLNGLYQRIDIILISVPVILNLIYYVKNLQNKNIVVILNKILFVTPIVFLLLGLTGQFNVLNMGDYMGSRELGNTGEDLTNDTRTLLYKESIESAINNNYVIIGRTPYFGYDSKWIKAQVKMFGGGSTYLNIPQRSSEVFVVNIFTWFGLIGILLFVILFFTNSIKAVQRSNNIYMNVISLYIAIFWVLCWITHNMFGIQMNFIILFILIALINNQKVLLMNNKEFETYFSPILNE